MSAYWFGRYSYIEGREEVVLMKGIDYTSDKDCSRLPPIKAASKLCSISLSQPTPPVRLSLSMPIISSLSSILLVSTIWRL